MLNDGADASTELALLQFNLEGGINRPAVIGTFSIISHVLQTSCGPIRGHAQNAETEHPSWAGEFQPCWLHCRSIAGRTVRPKDQVSEK